MTDTEIKLADWMVGGDTGMSSMFMARVFMGRYGMGEDAPHPWDPADFGRCHRLLEAVPELRGRMQDLKGRSDVWDRLVDNWFVLTQYYNQESPSGSCPKLYSCMQSLIRPPLSKP